MPQNYSLNGNLVSKEVYEKARGINQPKPAPKPEAKKKENNKKKTK